MQAEIGRLDPYDSSSGTAILGRLSDVLLSKSYTVDSFSVDAGLVALQGDMQDASKSSVVSKVGFRKFNPSDNHRNVSESISLLNGNADKDNGLLSNFWTSSLVSYALCSTTLNLLELCFV